MTPTVAEVRAQVEKVPGARVVGLHCSPSWAGPEHIEVGGLRYRVAAARSVLEFRQHVVDCEQEGVALVCLTDLDSRDLGADLIARLARRRLLSPDPWGAVKARFRVRRVDPDLLRSDRHLAVHLLACEPPGGFPLPPGEELSADFAWSVLWRENLGIRLEGFSDPSLVPDPVVLLVWSWLGSPERLRSAPRELMTAATTWFATRWGAPAEQLLAGLGSGYARELLPLGLVCLSIFHPQSQNFAAAARLERFVEHRPVDPAAGRRWGQLALEALGALEKLQGPEALAPVIHRADQLFEELYVAELAGLSPVSPLGFHQQLAHFGRCLQAWLAEPGSTETLEGLLAHLREHREARLSRSRLEPLEMAVRLTRYLQETPQNPDSLACQAQQYALEGAFVDRARFKLLRGTGPEELRTALAALFERLRERRQAENQSFATHVAGWYAANSPPHPEALGVEQVLDSVVAPLARKQPVLLVVLDGATWAVLHELLEDLGRRGWSLRAPGDTGSPLRPVLATLPSVTEFSRTSLLCGRLVAGKAPAEGTEFSRHPALLEVCTASAPPCLYHRLVVDEAHQKAEAQLLSRIEDRKYKVVAAVVNAVDDHLARDGQFDVAWNLESLRALTPLLEAAQRARRAVVLASDHGHVLELDTQLITSTGGGDRWQSRSGAPAAGELRFEGARVTALGMNSLLAPWSETLRYGVKKNGYHGGAALQEMLAPLVVLAPAGLALEGYREVPFPQPSWWSGSTRPLAQVPAPLYVAPSAPEPGQGDLFEESTPSPLFAALWNSPGFAARCQQRGLDAGPLRRLVELLEQAPGGLSDQELASLMQVPEHALKETLNRAAAVVNLDGQGLLTRSLDGEFVVLQVESLAQAYGLTRQPTGVETLEVVTVQGRRLHLQLALELSPLDRQILQAFARHETLSEKALGQAVKSRRASGAVESLVERLAQAGMPLLEPAGSGAEGRLYRFRSDRV